MGKRGKKKFIKPSPKLEEGGGAYVLLIFGTMTGESPYF